MTRQLDKAAADTRVRLSRPCDTDPGTHRHIAFEC